MYKCTFCIHNQICVDNFILFPDEIHTYHVGTLFKFGEQFLRIELGAGLPHNNLLQRLRQFNPSLARGAAQASGQDSNVNFARQGIGCRLLKGFSMKAKANNLNVVPNKIPKPKPHCNSW